MSTIYIHWPFCVSKCRYCDFHSVACCDTDPDFVKWLYAYKKVLMKFYESFYHGERITSVYFGGGTPSLLPVWFVNELLETIRQKFAIDDSAEITVEANPKTIDLKKASGLLNCGVNRISIGVQSIVDKDLKMLGRIHSSNEAIDCVFEMTDIFDNVSIDVIYNRPGQKIDSWISELLEIVKLPVNHISAYELIVEDGTPLKRLISSGSLQVPETSSEEYILKTIEILEGNGFEMYEVSNFARAPGPNGRSNRSRHNLSYWKYDDYYGIGPGSHSRVTLKGQKLAIEQINDNDSWLHWANDPIFSEDVLGEDEVFEERIIMGLRAMCGINIDNFSEDIRIRYKLENKLINLCQNSYIMYDGGRATLTREGILKLNLIVQYLTSGYRL